MDPFDVTEILSLDDNGKTVTIAIDGNEEELTLEKVNYVRMWLRGWATEEGRLSKSMKKDVDDPLTP